jgi:hypothetical protein
VPCSSPIPTVFHEWGGTVLDNGKRIP